MPWSNKTSVRSCIVFHQNQHNFIGTCFCNCFGSHSNKYTQKTWLDEKWTQNAENFGTKWWENERKNSKKRRKTKQQLKTNTIKRFMRVHVQYTQYIHTPLKWSFAYILQLYRKGAKMCLQLLWYCSCLSGSGSNGTSFEQTNSKGDEKS